MSFLVTRPARPLPRDGADIDVVLRGHLPDQRRRAPAQPLLERSPVTVGAIGAGRIGGGRAAARAADPSRRGAGGGGAAAGGSRSRCGLRHRCRLGRRGLAAAAARRPEVARTQRRRPRSRSARPPSAPRPSGPPAPGSPPARRRLGAGISASTLSVEISKIGSSRLTRVADLLDPARQGALGDRFAHLGHDDVDAGHARSPWGNSPLATSWLVIRCTLAACRQSH